jgi:AraC-like DNA-binding protein
MHLFFSFLRTLILLGAMQGLILSGLLYYSKTSRQSNRILAILIFLMSLASLNLYITDTEWFNHSQILILIWNIVPMVIVMPIGPLIYFYIRSFSDPGFVFKRKNLIHFIPVIIDLVPKLTAIIYMSGLVLKWFPKNDAPWGYFIDQYNVYSDIPRWLSISIYLWISHRYLLSLKKNGESLREKSITLPWLQQFVNIFAVFQVIWLVYLIPYVLPEYTERLMDLVGWYPVYVPLAILIYWLGIKGWMASANQRKAENLKVKTSSIPVHLGDDMIFRLKKAMIDEKLYLDPELNLSVLTKHTGIPSKSISAVLNQQMHKTFNEFINEYRVTAVKERLLASADKNLTIAGLAYECGFNSQPTFQRAFKSIQGESPSEFLRKNMVSSH